MFGSFVLFRMLKATDDLPILTQNCLVFLKKDISTSGYKIVFNFKGSQVA